MPLRHKDMFRFTDHKDELVSRFFEVQLVSTADPSCTEPQTRPSQAGTLQQPSLTASAILS